MNDLDVKEIREKFGLSQEKLAKLLGVTTRTIQNWEAGNVIPDSKHEILRELMLKPQAYFGGDQSNVNGNNIAGSNVTVNQTDTGKLIDLLARKEDALVLAQEHISRLMDVIERLQK